jgi:hypothetical protein
MDALGPGRIFWGVYPGPRGHGEARPMIVVSRRVDLIRTGRLLAVVCSTRFDPDDILPQEVLLPYREDGKGPTRLARPTVAVCDWTTPYDVADIRETSGIVPGDLLREICRLADITFPSER